MSNKNLFKEAIADAKAVREAALANAKAALEEALTPKLQSMLAEKMKEMEDLEEDAYEDGVEEGFDTEEFGFDRKNGDIDENEDPNELEEDFDLSAILAELDDESSLEEAKKEKEEEKEDEDEGSSEEEMPTNIDDLKALIADLITQEMGNEEEMKAPEEPMDMGDMGGGNESNEDEVPLEEEEINLEELLAELDSLDEADELEEAKDKAKKMAPKKEKEEKKEDEKEMKEALNVINTLRAELNEVNLLNAKLLYVNKIFKAKNLSESQKLQVIASFDKATTAKEAKVVYESLNATLSTPAKKQIKESLGFASKAAGVAPKKAIVESNDVISRMQKLANIIK
jgi:hypothetical protein